jgi:hypothetical protein
MEPAEAIEKMLPADATESMQPADPSDMIEPTENADWIEPLEQYERMDLMENSDLADSYPAVATFSLDMRHPSGLLGRDFVPTTGAPLSSSSPNRPRSGEARLPNKESLAARREARRLRSRTPPSQRHPCDVGASEM